MSCLGQNYNPNPTRDWSRVNTCQTQTFSPNVLLTVEQYNKGNILQYKKNSSNLTKNQRFSQIAKGMWTNRTKVFAVQGETYTNPNIRQFRRVNNSANIFLVSGLDTNLPITCDPNTPINQIVIPNGGALLCNQTENLCTGVVTIKPEQPTCYPSSNSDVPGREVLLCWNDGLATWYPRNRTTMNSSGGNKFPQGYKFSLN